MSRSSEHYKNHPNDIEASPSEKNMHRKFGKLRHCAKVNDIKKRISIMLLRTQLKMDSNIKDMFIEMYPEEYEKALKATMDKYGFSEKKEVRMAKIIKDMNLKDENILK